MTADRVLLETISLCANQWLIVNRNIRLRNTWNRLSVLKKEAQARLKMLSTKCV